ncbi:MAG: hypothetical protein GY903_21215 [Fuerstiella sp.]|nr:hypothetical protein [Fuerstiella sp.]MCP4857011.1 hypothetical protein [Fuerstiella sp.]
MCKPIPRSACAVFLSKRLLLVVALVVSVTSQAPAQLDGRLAARPLGVGYLRNINQVRMLEYIKHLSTRLEMDTSMFDSVTEGQLEGFRSEVDDAISGTAWYMVQGLIPSFENIYFQEVVDEADAKRMLNAQKERYGATGTLHAEPDGMFKLVNHNSWSNDVPKGKDPEEYVKQFQRSTGNRGMERTAKVIEVDGKMKIENTWTTTQYFRYQDQLLFSGNFEELWSIELPTTDSLTSGVDTINDMGLDAFFDRIPAAIKTLGWSMLSSGASTQMQQRDHEDQSIADLRKSSYQFGLDVTKALMFDVDQARGWLRFATDDQQSVRGELNFDTRRNSGLTKQLEEVSSGNSRFAPLLRDDAAATLHVCLRAFEQSDPLLTSAGAWLQKTIGEATNGDAVMVDGASRLAETLTGISNHQVLEAFVKVGWTETSGGVIYGGLQVDDNPELLRSLHNMIVGADVPTEMAESFEIVEMDGLEVIQITSPENITSEIAEETSLTLTHAYITHQNSCLWFAVGGENAIEIIRSSVARCSASGLAARSPLLTATVDMDRWLSYPQDDPTGVAGLLQWLDENVQEFPPSPMGFAFRGGQDEKPTPLLQRVADLGGEMQAGLTVIVDKGGIRLNLKMGEVIANYYVARMIDAQEKMMGRSRARAEERAEKAKKEAARANAEAAG